MAEHSAGNQPGAHALLALMLLNGARLPTRVDADGNILRLEEQNRSQRDQSMIARGLYHLMQSTAGDEASEYHLQAAISACHCAAQDYEATDWPRILSLYDRLIEIDDSPVVALNRAVAVANVRGPRAGIEAVEAIHARQQLNCYYLLYAVLGEFEADSLGYDDKQKQKKIKDRPRGDMGQARKTILLHSLWLLYRGILEITASSFAVFGSWSP